MMNPTANPMATEMAVGTGSIQMPLTEKTVSTEVNGDFSLPDYQPEIKRLIRIDTSCLPPTRYAGGGNVDLGGSVDYFVLYMGNDDQLYCAPLSSDYRMTVSADGDGGMADGLSEPLVCVCDVTPDAPAGRVTAPRRLNIRCRLKANVKVYGEKNLSCADENGLMPGSLERLEGRAEVGRVFQATGELLELQDDIILSSGGSTGGEQRVICAEGQVMVNEASAGSDMINCRGEVTLKLTLCPAEPPLLSADGTEENAPATIPYILTRKIPFAQAVELEGVTPACACCAYGVCSGLTVQVEEGHLHVEMGVILEALAQRNETVTYTKDLYSTRSSDECRYETYAPQGIVRCINGNFTLSDSRALSEAGIDPAARVVDAVAAATPEALVCDKGRYLLTGTCRCQLLLYRQGEYSGAEMTFPFRYETDATCPVGTDDGAPVPAFDGHISVVNCRARMDGERIGMDAELAVCLRLTDTRPLTALSGISFGSELTHRRGEYVICFPAPTDTLWSVAKRYHAPLATLVAANALSPSAAPDTTEALEGVKYLIV